MIKTPYKNYEFKESPSGTGMETVYQWKYNNDGTRELEMVDEKNVYHEIQQYKEDCDIVNIISRLGGINNLQQLPPRGVYADMTQLPKNLYEAVELQEKAKNSFLKLPKEIREDFNNDMLQFMASIGTEKWNSSLKKYEENQKSKMIQTSKNKENVNE